MANELQYFGDLTETGSSVSARVYDGVGAQVGAAVTMSEVGATAIFMGDMPTASAGSYGVRFLSGSSLLASGTIHWDGTAEINLTTIGALIECVLADSNELLTNQGNFSTATGFATPANVTAAQSAIIAEVQQSEAGVIAALPGAAPTAAQIYTEFTSGSNENAFKADVSSLATSSEIAALNDPTAAQIATAVEAAIINEGDGQQVIDAIVQAVGNENVTASTIAAAVWSATTRTVTGGQVDTIAGTVSTLDALDAAQDVQHALTQAAIGGTLDANLVSVNGVAVDGAGTAADPFGPA